MQFDKHQRVDDLEKLRKEESHTVEHFLHLREGNDKSAHPTAANRQTVPENWMAEYAKGPRTLAKDASNTEAKKVHAAFLEAFDLPFHQYPQETAVML